MPREIAIIGDYFMLSSMFERAIRERCRLHDLSIRTMICPGRSADGTRLCR